VAKHDTTSTNDALTPQDSELAH